MADHKPTTAGSTILLSASPKRPHLIQSGGGVAGEVLDLRQDVVAALKPLAAITVEEWTTPPTGAVLKLSATPKQRAGGYVLIKEIVDGVEAGVAGTIDATTYTPNDAPDGTHSYAIYYEVDPG